jgi:predicted polyphosphate/ATP-dependent NAD kinase
MGDSALGFVGIIANPASGKDIRRLVSQATTVNNHEKVSIVRRVLLSLFASGAGRVEIMPDCFGIGSRALDGLCDHSGILAATSLIDMPLKNTADDSQYAAQYLRDTGAGCIVVLGGDGTCRVVSKGCGDVPLLPISTGTNNVVPDFIEGTVAGSAAAYVALHPDVERLRFCHQHKRLLVYVNDEMVDQALVEVALVSSRFVGTRAIWEVDRLRQVFVARAQPVNIGMSAIIGVVHPIAPTHPGGASATIASDGRKVMVPLAPGRFALVGVGEIADLKPGVRYPVDGGRPAILALDGEREIALYEGDDAKVMLDLHGPWIVDVERTLLIAVKKGMFLRRKYGNRSSHAQTGFDDDPRQGRQVA